MEQLIREIEQQASVLGMTPQSLLRKALGASWSTWSDWASGKSSPTLATVDKLRAWIASSQAVDAKRSVG